ncbi:MAG: hypothetical protein M1817_004327 [Caeruleum heppii]|nr:MAG: hypothetical protein M1817_004327 [Caeruleum heppii]
MLSVSYIGARSRLPQIHILGRWNQSSGVQSDLTANWRRFCGEPVPAHFRRRNRFSTGAAGCLQQQATRREGAASKEHKKPPRSPPGKHSLRRVAVEAQRSRDGVLDRRNKFAEEHIPAKRVKAYCATEQFDMNRVTEILENEEFDMDPFSTGLYPQVIHVQLPAAQAGSLESGPQGDSSRGDVFIFPSGTVVTWSVSEDVALQLVTKTLAPAADNSHAEDLETEELEYLEDPVKENSSIRGDVITIGTKTQSSHSPANNSGVSADTQGSEPGAEATTQRDMADTILAKIAFSSGLARSTKLAVLETLLSDYFESTRSIPTMLSRGSRLPFTRSFILRKTGQLLGLRAQLNLYSELTDSLPDLFWDSRHELGLEGYYDQVGRALDVGIRIKVLNEKMDYAQEIASVLRERLSEKHGLVLEWMIIALITIEVAFEVLRLWKENREKKEARLLGDI